MTIDEGSVLVGYLALLCRLGIRVNLSVVREKIRTHAGYLELIEELDELLATQPNYLELIAELQEALGPKLMNVVSEISSLGFLGNFSFFF